MKDVRYSWKSQRVFLSLSLFYVPFIDEKKSGIELVAKKVSCCLRFYSG